MEGEPVTKKPRVFFVYNPVSGADDAGAGRQSLEDRLNEAGWDYNIYETTPESKVADVVREAAADGYDAIVAGGGDGTVSMVASGLVDSKVPLAIVPLGTGNVMAQELEIPLDSNGALDLLTGVHALREVDAMNVNGQYYFLTVSVGLSTAIMEKTKREQKRRFGFLAYVWNGIKEIGGFKLRYYNIIVDGRRMNSWASEIMVANCGIVGLKQLREDLGIRPDDGEVETCIVRSRTFVDLVGLAWNVVFRRVRHSTKVHCQRAKKTVYINTHDNIQVEGDGEIIGETPIQLEVVPKAIRVIVPEVVERPVSDTEPVVQTLEEAEPRSK